MLVGVVVAVVTAALSVGDSGEIPQGFYAVAAQIAPVLLVALVVEQRIATVSAVRRANTSSRRLADGTATRSAGTRRHPI